MVGGLVLISMATPWVSETVRERWFALPEIIALMAIPAMTAGDRRLHGVLVPCVPRQDGAAEVRVGGK